MTQFVQGVIKAARIKVDEQVFRRDDGSPICHELFFRQFFVKDVREAKVPAIRFHDLRHTATTLMIAKGLDIKTVQEICGHKSITTTMEYVHLLGDRVKDAWRIFSILPRVVSTETDSCRMTSV